MKQIVCNASPLITLAKAGLLNVLPDLFQQIFCPQAVVDEIFAGPPEDVMRRMLQELSWLERVSLNPPLSPLGVWRLGRGESEVIEYARLNPGNVALLDDRAARKVAAAVGVAVYGTLSIIARWVSLDSSRSFDEAISLLRKAGLYVDERTIQAVRNRVRVPI
jgi:predicted nucleic acid-binding protein